MGSFNIKEDDVVEEGRTRTVFKYRLLRRVREKSILCAPYGEIKIQ